MGDDERTMMQMLKESGFDMKVFKGTGRRDANDRAMRNLCLLYTSDAADE